MSSVDIALCIGHIKILLKVTNLKLSMILAEIMCELWHCSLIPWESFKDCTMSLLKKKKLADWIVMLLLRKLGGKFSDPCFYVAWIVCVRYIIWSGVIIFLLLYWYNSLINCFCICTGVGGCGHVLYLSLQMHLWGGFIYTEEWELERLCWWTYFLINCKDRTRSLKCFNYLHISLCLVFTVSLTNSSSLLLHTFVLNVPVLPIGGRRGSISMTSC